MAQWRLCGSAYRSTPFEAAMHSQYLLHVSSPSTVDNEGGGWLATGPIGYPSGFAFADHVEANVRQTRAVNRGLVADKYFYYQVGDRLFRADYVTEQDVLVDGFMGNSWSTMHTFTNQEAGRTGRNTGIYPTIVRSSSSGIYERYIVGVYNSTVAGANTWKGFRHNIDTAVTSETAATDLSFAATPAQGGVKAEVFFKNRLYFIGNTDGGVGIYNPAAQTVSRLTWPTSDIWGPHDFCAYKGELYCLNRAEHGGGGGSGLYIWKIDGAITLAVNFAVNGFSPTSFASEQFEGRCLLFTDKNYLYAATMTFDNSTGATRFFRFTQGASGLLVLDGINPTVAFGDEAGVWGVRLNSFIDHNLNPDGPPNITINIDESGMPGAARSQHGWIGPTSSVTIEESHDSSALHVQRETARSHIKGGGGERVWVPPAGGPKAEIVGFDYGTQSGRVLVNYQIFNNIYDFPAGTPCTVQLRYDMDNHIPSRRATLIGPSVGSLAENNTVIQIPAAESGINHSFEWNYAADGLSPTNIPDVCIFISTTGVP